MAKKQTAAESSAKKNEVEIEMTYARLIDFFFPAIDHLGNLAIKKADVLTKIVKTKRKVRALLEDYDEARKALLEQDCLKDNDGKPIFDLDEDTGKKEYRYESPEIKMEAISTVSDLLQQKISITVTPIRMAQLNGLAGLSGNVIESLEDFVEID